METVEQVKDAGTKLYREKSYLQAAAKYTEAIKLDSSCATYYNNRAACFLMLEDPASALDDSRQATCLDPNFVKGWSRMAKCSLLLGDKVAAAVAGNRLKQFGEAECHDVLENVEKFSQCKHSGETAVTVGHYSDGAYWFRQCVQLAPFCVAVRLALADCLLHKEMYAEAMEEVNRVLAKNTVDSEALFVRGLCFYYQEMMDKAMDHFKTVLKFSPDHQQAKDMFKKAKNLTKLKEFGNEAFKAGDFQNALENYTEALCVDLLHKKTNSKLYFNRATVQAKLGDVQKCIDDCTAALDNDANYLKPLLRRAKTYMEIKDYENAEADYERANRMDPQNTETKQLLKKAKLEKKKLNRKDYYKILCLDTKATDDEIKKAYRTQAMKHHPDKHTAAGEEKQKLHEKLFKEVGEAYAVLSDPRQKEIHDTGEDIKYGGWDVDEDGNIDSEAIWQQFFGGGNTTFVYL